MTRPAQEAALDDDGLQLERMQLITDSLPDLMAWVSSDFRYEFVNSAYERWFGVQRAEIIGKPVREVLGDLAFETIRPHLEAALRGETITFEALTRYRLGGTRNIRATYVPRRDPSGRVVGFVSLVADLTEHKRAQARLQILAEASVAFAEASLDPHRLAETIARKITDAIGDSCSIRLLAERSDVLEHAAFFHRDPEAQRVLDRMFSEVPLRLGEGVMGTVAQSQTPMLLAKVDFQEVLEHTKPEYRPFVARYPAHTLMAVPLKARGRTLGVLGMARDETPGAYDLQDLRLAEDLAERAAMAVEVCQLLARDRAAIRRATALADASKAIHATLDHREAIETIVDIGASMLGDACVATLVENGSLHAVFARHRNAAAGVYLQRIVGEQLPMEHGLAAEVLRTGKAIRIEDAATRYGTGLGPVSEYSAVIGMSSLLICPLRVEGRVIGTLGLSRDRGGQAYTDADELFLQDLADRVALVVHNGRLYQAAQVAQAEAERASSLKDEFLSAASHELRTPIASLQLLLQMMIRQLQRMGAAAVPAARLLPKLVKAERQGRRLAGLTDSLLDASRISAGRLQLTPREGDLCDLVRSVVSRFEEQAAESGTPVTVVAPPALRGVWDLERLDQVVTNLLTNAIKYGNRQPVTITVSEAPGHVKIAVEDKGIGIASEHQRRIFERFERAESVRSFGGFGVGLWLVHEILKSMGGTITVESAPGKGARFTVDLPR